MRPPTPDAHPAAPRLSPRLEEALRLGALWLGCGVLGFALGCGLALLLRVRRLAWTFSLLGLIPVALLCLAAIALVPVAVLAPVLTGTAGATCGALVLSLRWELEDRRAGGERRAALSERRRPLDGLRARHAERGGRPLAGGVPIGRTRRGELACVPRGSAESGRHVLVPGATGAGKTTSLAALLVDYVVRSGFGAIVLEAKNDAALLRAGEAAARARGVPFRLFSPDGPSSYDPLAHGSVDERSERLLAVEDWGSADAAFYRQAASPFLRLLLRALDGAGEPATLAGVAGNCDLDELANLALAGGDPDLVAETDGFARGLRGDQQRAVAGLRARLQNLASSDLARAWLDPIGATQAFDLRAVIERREVAYFRFDTDRTGNVGRAVAQMVLLDLGATASRFMGEGVGTFVAVDEFGALEAPALERLFARGRAAGFSVALGTQTLADLRAAGPAVRERVGATISGLLCHRIGEQADAEWVAQLIGAVPTWQATIRTDGLGLPIGEGTRTRGYRFEVNPSQLQRLEAGEVYVAALDRGAPRRSARVRVVPPWHRLAEVET